MQALGRFPACPRRKEGASRGPCDRPVIFPAAAADEGPVWWPWVVGGLTVWLVVGSVVAFAIGRGVRLADERSPGTGVAPVGASAPSSQPRRGWVPLPPVGVALIVVLLALQTSGFVFRLTGTRGALAQTLSMDAPFSVPRLFVAGLFVVAAVAAAAGAAVQQGRRSWWLAVAAVAAGIAAVKAGSTWHADAMKSVSASIGSGASLVLSALLAAAVVGGLWFLSRHERRDRRRVVAALSGYAVAVVGLSAVSAWIGGVFGASSAAAATFVEESGEGLAGVAFLLAVLVGVAPQLVLPRAWVLRRQADAAAREAARGRPTTTPRTVGR